MACRVGRIVCWFRQIWRYPRRNGCPSPRTHLMPMAISILQTALLPTRHSSFICWKHHRNRNLPDRLCENEQAPVPPILKMSAWLKKILCWLGKWAGFVLLLPLRAKRSIAQTTYEAESAVLSNGAKAAGCSFCSGGQQVQNIGGPDNGTVTFDRVQVPRGGLYPMTVYFNVGDDRAATITVNGSARVRCDFSSCSGTEPGQQPEGARCR